MTLLDTAIGPKRGRLYEDIFTKMHPASSCSTRKAMSTALPTETGALPVASGELSRAHYTILIRRNPQNSIWNILGPYTLGFEEDSLNRGLCNQGVGV